MIWDDHPPPWQPSPEEYYASALLTGSGALKIYCRSPEAYRDHMLSRCMDLAMGRVVSAEKPSVPVVMGSVLDCMLTEPDGEFEKRFVRTNDKRPSHVRRPKVSDDLYVTARKMEARVRQHSRAREIMSRPGLRQMCHAWRVDDVWYRLRADWVTQANDGSVILPDLKCWSVDVRDEWAVRRHAARLGTYLQMALYGQGIEDLWGRFPIIALIIVSSLQPHRVVVRYLHEQKAFTEARMQVAEAQQGISEAFKTGVFCDKIDEEIRAL